MEELTSTVFARRQGARPRIFSGMQPTGEMHLGNYMGALVNWVRLAESGDYEPVYCIVDYHAITMPYDRDQMQERIFNMAVVMLASGLSGDNCTLFVQSHVPEHTELAWVLSSMTMMGRLQNMTQFKDKSARLEEKNEGINAGLFTYPILQAADILLYKGEFVPVGEDQSQHLELSREVARRFNASFGPVFPEPRTLHTQATRILGLDGQSKMSKSLNNHIAVLESPESVTQKLTRQAMSDPARKRLSDPGDPDICYVYGLHRIFSPAADLPRIAQQCREAQRGCFHCKKELADNVNALMEPVRQRAQDLSRRPDDVWDILLSGAARARDMARQTMEEVRSVMGLVRK